MEIEVTEAQSLFLYSNMAIVSVSDVSLYFLESPESEDQSKYHWAACKGSGAEIEVQGLYVWLE